MWCRLWLLNFGGWCSYFVYIPYVQALTCPHPLEVNRLTWKAIVQSRFVIELVSLLFPEHSWRYQPSGLKKQGVARPELQISRALPPHQYCCKPIRTHHRESIKSHCHNATSVGKLLASLLSLKLPLRFLIPCLETPQKWFYHWSSMAMCHLAALHESHWRIPGVDLVVLVFIVSLGWKLWKLSLTPMKYRGMVATLVIRWWQSDDLPPGQVSSKAHEYHML